ncbi:hypothetical protein Vretimale_11975 [Volvox reticuliferus]|uniref:DUF4350 domain-containing protein n=1 Tax=Volvox reticuliferus TaxID=1737510 RepID=A0A8J4GHP3_9CHLO|nr:hypothetical protein Vretifemale_11477 [Volvox reticuliferus]GIM07978.1 hypothetical protein Vretimale_11975 [Volvox reticuliferus]
MFKFNNEYLLKAIFIIISCLAGVTASNRHGQHLAAGRPLVSIYSSSTSGLLDSSWDSISPINLENALRSSSYNVVRFAGKAVDTPFESASSAFVIPPLTGDCIYTDVEDIEAINAFVRSGGLVIVHDSVRRPRATQDLVAAILGYSGSWDHCEAVAVNAAYSFVTSTSVARDFLNVRWPTRLEGARVQLHSWCKHEDPNAVSYPLYALGGDTMKAAVQAFAKVGIPGAVVWLGYDWQGGAQQGWDAMLREVINAFVKGSFHGPVDASLMDKHPLRLDGIVDSDGDLEDFVRRYLSSSTGPAGGGVSYGGYFPSPQIPNYPPSPAPTIAPPSPSPMLPPPKPSTVAPARFMWFHNMTAHGVQGILTPVVWFDDADFASQLNLRYNNSKLWLVNRSKQPSCSKEPPCGICQRAWYPYNGSDVAGFPNRTVVLYFREPVILKRVTILEMASIGVEEVFLLGWPAVPIPQLGLNVTRRYDNVTQSDVFTKLTRTRLSVCSSKVEAVVKPPRSDEPQRVPGLGYDQTHLPPFFQERAIGGVGIRLRAQLNPRQVHTQIAQVLFSGRVLYPQNPGEYAPYPRPRSS